MATLSLGTLTQLMQSLATVARDLESACTMRLEGIQSERQIIERTRDQLRELAAILNSSAVALALSDTRWTDGQPGERGH